MAFVREEISEKDWELFNSWKLKETAHKKVMKLEMSKVGLSKDCYYLYNGYSWSLDRGRNAYYIFLGGQDRGQIRVYVLIWQGYKIYMTLENYLSHDTIRQIKTYYSNVTKLYIPEYLRKKETEVRELIKEAITANIIRSESTKLEINITVEPCFLENPEERI